MGAVMFDINTEVAVSIGVNLITIAFFAGVYFEAQKNIKLQIANLEKIKELTEKQDKHNNLIERTFACEKDITLIKEQIKVENHRIEDLEEVQNGCIRKRN